MNSVFPEVTMSSARWGEKNRLRELRRSSSPSWSSTRCCRFSFHWQHRLDPGHQGRLVDGLGQILVGARLEPGHDVLRVGFGGHQDDRDEGEVAVALEVLADLDAVHLGHHDVEQDQVRLPFAGERQAFLAVAGRVDLVAVDRKPGFEDVAVGRVVVDDENVRRISHGSAYLGGTQGKYSRILASSLRVLTGLEK
jgi:hypothetical protein